MQILFNDLDINVIKEIVLINAPSTLEIELSLSYEFLKFSELRAVTTVAFCLAFVTHQYDLDQIIANLVPKVKDDAVLWFCYPRADSIHYADSEMSWFKLNNLGYRSTQPVALDSDWLVLKFCNDLVPIIWF